jgi:hypothetical protein
VEAERIVQPTDFRVRSVFVFLGHGGREEVRAWHRTRSSRAGRHRDAEDRPMKDRLMRLLATLGAVAALALAGGASLRGF